MQDVIIAQQTNRINKNVIIPTPENAICVADYDKVAVKMERTPAMYIRVPGECVGTCFWPGLYFSRMHLWQCQSPDPLPIAAIVLGSGQSCCVFVLAFRILEAPMKLYVTRYSRAQNLECKSHDWKCVIRHVEKLLPV